MSIYPFSHAARRLAVVAAVPVIASLLLLGCGDDDDDDSDGGGQTSPTAESATEEIVSTAAEEATQEEPATTEEEESPPAETDSGDSVGSVDVGGQQFAIRELLRCEPFFEHPDDLDLTALGEGITFFAVINHPISGSDFVSHEVSLQGSAVGLYAGTVNASDGQTWTDEDNNPLPGPAFVVAGDRISGSMTLRSVDGSREPVLVSFDLLVPEEIEDCSL